MPQMFPMNWMILFIYFLFFFIIMNINNYYLFNIFKKTNKKIMIKTNKLSWKW